MKHGRRLIKIKVLVAQHWIEHVLQQWCGQKIQCNNFNKSVTAAVNNPPLIILARLRGPCHPYMD